MLEGIFGKYSLTVDRVVTEAFDYFGRCQQSDGSLAEDPAIDVFQQWDTVNALKALSLWQRVLPMRHEPVVRGMLGFLSAREKPTGMLSWGATEIGPGEYCTETSSEYISALVRFGYTDLAYSKAEFLRDKQRADGPWAEVHGHIPKAFQLESSVTGFALCALDDADIAPKYIDEALEFLANRQSPAGDFGINWYYYCTHYYLMRPAVAALSEYGNYGAVARARDFVLGHQRPDGSWFSRVDGFHGEPSPPELQTALALMTLAHTGMAVADPPVQLAVEWLLDRRRSDGSWFGGRYPYPETESYRSFRATQDVYTTAQVLAAFNYLEQP